MAESKQPEAKKAPARNRPAKTEPTTIPAEKLPEQLAGDTSLRQLAGIDIPFEADNARDFTEYLLKDDIAESNALVMFKEQGIESKDIGSETFQSPHTDMKGQYVSFVFTKPGIVLMPMAAWRYFETEIYPSIPNKADFKFVGVDRKFTKLTPAVREIVVQHLWDPDLLNSIPKAVPELRELVNQRFRKIEERERLVKLGFRNDNKVPTLSSL